MLITANIYRALNLCQILLEMDRSLHQYDVYFFYRFAKEETEMQKLEFPIYLADLRNDLDSETSTQI